MATVKKIDTYEVADFVYNFTRTHGNPPTHRVLADRFHVTRSAAAYHLAKLKNAPALPAARPAGAHTTGVHKETVLKQKDAGQPTLKFVRPRPVEPPAALEPQPEACLPRFLLIVIIAVGLGCAVMSAVNTATFLVNSGRPVPLAGATSILTTLFTGTAFWVGASCLRKRLYSGVLFYTLAVCIIGFSVFSSISVCYENMKSAEAGSTEAQEFVSQTAALLAVNAKEQEITGANIAAITAEREKLQEEAEYWRNKSWAKHDNLQAQVSAAEGRVATVRSRLGELLIEERSLKSRGSETAAASAKTIYTFLSGGDVQVERGLRFAALAIPAVFFDLAAPLMLGVALLSLRKPVKPTRLTS